ncbi:MAG: prephenate dehydratase [Armatimonadota bacterium]|nr:prephenate dehydratase [Armatimonadota bacterium]MDR7422542.1 prephenate dehydratase [Armatimonadota bacterium]MDR7454211.1 prephenate dehydratase [Armatimonadota bacterium]MDR7457866.1 prephenate dehydratase [Armatimonadota bacterium]MDR7497313.1 prephenate dehydratase [Armatimonadota bacterium]
MKVAFQGERGAYSEAAAIAHFGEITPVPCRTLAEVFDAVERGEVARGLVPVENSQAGSINETYDLLARRALHIVGEHNLRIEHCLLALPGETLETIRTVMSHPQALAQCEAFLARGGWELLPAHDTAGSARIVATERRSGVAAIAGRRAAEIYGLAVLAEGIETSPVNVTRFLALSQQPAPPAGRSKMSIVFTTANVPGALYRALGAFATRGLNLTKLESRPRRDRPWEYMFYVDCEVHHESPEGRAALADLAGVTAFLRVLGSYPRAPE